jgi:molybdenum cofactor cytidylyltransferase
MCGTSRPFVMGPIVIVLAAGRGERFAQSGGATHKLDALLGGVPVLQRVLHTVAASGLPFHVVRPERGRTADGMGDSIARGVAATADASGWLILPGDLPLVSVRTLRLVAQALASGQVVLPFWRGHHGHPVGFGKQCGSSLAMLSGDVGAAAIVRARRQSGEVRELAVDDPGIVMDVDTVGDLAHAEALLALSCGRGA